MDTSLISELCITYCVSNKNN